MDRQLTLTFIGKDQSLTATAKGAGQALGQFRQNVEGAARGSKTLVDEQGRLRNAQGQFVDATKLSSLELTKLRRELTAAGEDVGLFDENLRRSRESMIGLTAVSGGLATAIGGLFQRGTQEFVAFEGGIKQAGVVSGATEEELSALREEVERLGIVTSKAPAEIANTSVSLSRAGFTAQETTVALEGVARASEATGESLATVGNIIAQQVRVFGLAAEEAGRIGDVLVATANNSNTTVSSIGESLSFVGAQANAANQPIEDVAVLIGLLGDAGISGSRAGTNLGSALEKLQLASAGAESEFSDLVRGNEKATAAFEAINLEVRNTDGTMQSLLEILPQLQNNLNDLEQGDRELVTKALFGTQGSRAILSLLGATEERVDTLTDSVRNSANTANESGEALLQGLGGALSLLEGSVGATLIKFGEFTSVGLEPLVRAATATLNAFLSLPGPIQQVLVGTVAFTGVLAAAIAALTTYNLLQVQRRAGEIAGAAVTAARTLAEQANIVVTTAAAAANAVFTGSINAEAIAQALSTARTGAATIAKQAYTLATGQAGVATLAFAGNLALLAAQAVLVVAAVRAIAEVFRRSEGAEFAKGLSDSVRELEKTREASNETADSFEAFDGEVEQLSFSLDGLRDAFDRAQRDFEEVGPVEAAQRSMQRLRDAIFDTETTADRFGGSWGSITTRTQRGAQLAQFAVEDAFEAMGDSVQDTTALLSRFGQFGPDRRSLGTAELEEFTAAVTEQAAALQEEIAVLQAQRGQSAELDEQLQNEINTRERLISTLQTRVEELGGEANAVDDSADSVRSLTEVLKELGDEYDDLGAKAALANDELLAGIAQQEAEGLITAAQAESARLDAEASSLEDSISRNEDLLERLQAQRSLRAGNEEETATLDDEILQVQREIAQSEREIFEQRAEATREANQEAEKEAEEAAKRQEEIAKEAAEARADVLRAEQEEAAVIRQRGFDDLQRSQSDQFEANEDATETAFDDQRRTAEAAFNDAQRLETAAFEETQQAREEAFAAKLQGSDRAFNESEQAREEQFNLQQQARQQQFNDRQRAAAAAFAESQASERAIAEDGFAAERLRIERELQLQDAGSAEARAELEARFNAEDEEAARREEAFAELVAEEEAFAEKQRTDAIAFEEQQRTEKLAFDESNRLIQQKFDEGQQLLAEAFELRKQESQALFEENQQLLQTAFDEQQRLAEQAFEENSRNIEREFAAAQQAREAAFEEEQRQAERAFKDEERALDRANAIAVQNILSGDASATPDTASQPTQSLRHGGIARGGVVQVHADEFLIPPMGTRVVSQRDSRRMVQEFLIQNPIAPTAGNRAQPLTQNYSGIPEKLDSLIGLLRSQPRPNIKAGGNTYVINGEPDPTTAATRVALDQVKAVARMRY